MEDLHLGRIAALLPEFVMKDLPLDRTLMMMYYYFILLYNFHIRRRGVVARVPAFQPGGPGSIPGGVRNFNFCPWIGCVSFVFCPVLSPAEALTLC